MYWTGRYFERAQALARAVAGYERLSLDLPPEDALDITPLLALVGSEPARDRAPIRSELLQLLVLDAGNTSSVRGALGAARENLRSGRSVMPGAIWAPVNRLHARLGKLRAEDASAVCTALDDVEAIGSQVEGQLSSSMTRDAAFSFWCIGSHIERADMLLRVLGVLVPRLMGCGDRRFADVRATGLLGCVGAGSMFRRRHQTRADLPTVLDFLLTDGAYPRSLKGLVATIERELDVLPLTGRARDALAACVPLEPFTTLSPAAVPPLFRALLERCDDFSDVVAETFFPAGHRRANAESPKAVVSLPPASDPFESLGREHAAVEAVLRLVDELVARATCGRPVDRNAVRAVVDFFTDYGVLGHHEKEEAILMPVLLGAGFDWHDGPLAAMRRDHKQEHYFLRVLTHLCARGGPWSEEDLRHFAGVSAEFTQFLRAHMRLESRDVFEPASARLSDPVKATLMHDLACFDAHGAAGVGTALERLDGLLHEYGVALRPSSRAADAPPPAP
jgi:uncharacterized alpha-E superfamily protein/hemerythrin-like domain-containing protein